jgi:hypothetical protein
MSFIGQTVATRQLGQTPHTRQTDVSATFDTVTGRLPIIGWVTDCQLIATPS